MRLAWKIYFWLFSFLVVLTLFSIGQWKIVDYGWLTALVVIGVPLYGYTFQKKVGQGSRWQILVSLSALYYVVYTFYLDPKYGGLPSRTLSDYLVTILIPLFGYLAAIRYSMFSKN